MKFKSVTDKAMALAALLALSACVSDKPAAAVATPAVVTAKSGAETHLARGQWLEIALASNASTGYVWEIVEDGAPVLVPAAEDFVAADTSTSPMPGAGGTSRWRFSAAQAGAATLRLVYRRSWEKDVPPAQTATYRVIVD